MRGAVCWSDHCLVRSTVILRKRRSRGSRRKKLDVNRLQSLEVKMELQAALDVALCAATNTQTSSTEQDWANIRDAVYDTATKVLGFAKTP